MRMKIKLSQNESEIVSSCGFGSHVEADPEGKFMIINSYQAGAMAHRIDEAIKGQETDQGDWLRAKEWRDAKGDLINKLRQLILRNED